MKVETIRAKEEFKPIEIKITIESKDELIDLFNRMRIVNQDLYRTIEKENYDGIDYPTDKGTELSMVLYYNLFKYMRE